MAASPDEAFALFTPEGERRWIAGWEPEYLGDAAAPKGPALHAFRTRHHPGEETLWMVTRCEPPRLIEYARITPGSRMGTVRVECEPEGARIAATITYRLVALSPAGEQALDAFTREFAQMLATWERWIARLTPEPR